MAITDLNGTKWQIDSLTCRAGYGMFSLEGLIYNGVDYETANIDQIYIGFAKEEGVFYPVDQANSVMLYPEVISVSVGDIIEFKDGETGSSLTKQNLINWLENNATLLYQPPEPILQLAPFLTNIANAIRNKKGTTDIIKAQDFASEIESIESGGGSGFPIYTMTDNTGYLISKAIGIIDKNGVYHKYEADFHNNDTSYNVTGSNKMIAFVVSDSIRLFESINSVVGLFNLSTGTVATPSNIYGGAILVLTGDDAKIDATF